MKLTKSEQLYRLLAERISMGKYPVGSRFPSEYMLADEFGVNKKTANKSVDQLAAAGLLKRTAGGAGTIVIKTEIFPRGQIAFISDHHMYQMRILYGVQRTALEHGYATSVFFPENLDCCRLVDSFCNSSIQGVILCSHAGIIAKDCKLPHIVVDHDASMESGGSGVVNTDNYSGGQLIMDEVLRRGHRNIVIYSSARHYLDRNRRIDGMLESMSVAQIREPRKRVFYGSHYNDQEAVSALRKIHKYYPETTIILCDADDAARSMLRAAKTLQIRIPEDIAITSYGNSMEGTEILPTVEQFPEQIGSMACQLLLQSIQDGPTQTTVRELIKPKVVYPELIPDLTRKM